MEVLKAYLKAARSLFLPGVLFHFLWPGLLAGLLWFLGLYWGLGPAIEGLKGLLSSLPHPAWLSGGFFGALGNWAVGLLIVSVSGLLAIVLAVLIVASISLPLMLDHVARKEYAELEMRLGGSIGGSVWNVVKALVLLLVALVICLPLFFVPGGGLAVMLGLSAWFNLRCFRYDALMNHADKAEMRRIPASRRFALFGVGLIGALLCLVPVLNLLSPALCGLAFTHYLLSALREERNGNGRFPKA